MVKAKGPVWHKKHKEQGIIPEGLTGLDKEATWSRSLADGWVYGHGTFSIVSHKTSVLGCFMWMPNSAYEPKRMYEEAYYYRDSLSHLVMDSKADSQPLFHDLKKNYQIRLVTVCRKSKKMNRTPARNKMIAAMGTKRCRKYFKERSQTVEPMQGIVKNIFDIDRCWMRGDANNRWVFAAMGLTVQMHQLRAYRNKQSTWKIKSEVLGEP